MYNALCVQVVEFYISQSQAANHAVREAACACIAELGTKVRATHVQYTNIHYILTQCTGRLAESTTHISYTSTYCTWLVALRCFTLMREFPLTFHHVVYLVHCVVCVGYVWPLGIYVYVWAVDSRLGVSCNDF